MSPMWGGFMRVPIHGAVYPISPNSDMTARLQQSSILDWAQSQHQSAASGTGVVVATRSHIILAASTLHSLMMLGS